MALRTNFPHKECSQLLRSFGIVLWEMFSLGKNPYPGVSPADVYSMLQRGERMEKPDYCPRVVYRTMLDCWNSDPSQVSKHLGLKPLTPAAHSFVLTEAGLYGADERPGRAP